MNSKIFMLQMYKRSFSIVIRMLREVEVEEDFDIDGI